MVTKADLIGLLEDLLRTEESAIHLYTGHIAGNLFLSGFTEESKQKILAILSKLNIDSNRHAGILARLISKIKKGETDVY